MKIKATRTLWTTLASVLLAVCPVTAYEAEEVKDGGTIGGTVTFEGSPPPRQKIAVDTDMEICGTHAKLTEDLIVSSVNKGIQNVVVSISNIKSGKALVVPQETYSLDQKGCWFTPHIQIVPAGATIDVLNNDGIMHNIHTLSMENPPFNKAQPKFKKKLQMTLEYGEIIRVKCDIHAWMGGWIIVVEHPYYVLTDESGGFQLADVPPGTYTLEYWHETLGRQTREVTVTVGAETRSDISLKPGSTESE